MRVRGSQEKASVSCSCWEITLDTHSAPEKPCGFLSARSRAGPGLLLEEREPAGGPGGRALRHARLLLDRCRPGGCRGRHGTRHRLAEGLLGCGLRRRGGLALERLDPGGPAALRVLARPG